MTEAKAYTWLVNFEERNSDLSKRARRVLGLFALAANRKVPRIVVDKLLGYESSVFYRDVSRRWWLILYYSGIARYWKRFAKLAEMQGLADAWRWLSPQLSSKKRALVLQRLGSRPWRASRKWRRQHGHTGSRLRWFKMGTWYTNSPWTWLLIEGKSLAFRRGYTQPIHRKIRRHARLLERECYRRIDPDEVTPPEAMHSTVVYLRQRLKEVTGHKRISLSVIAWFLTVCLPESERNYVRPVTCLGAAGQSAMLGARRLMRAWR